MTTVSPRPSTNIALLTAMQRAAESGRPDARLAIHQALADGPVLVATTEPSPGEQPLPLTVPGRDGRPLVLAFTDLEALSRWADGTQPWASIGGADLCSLTLSRGGTGIVLNPSGPYAGELTRDELQLVADSTAFDVEGMEDGGARLVLRDPSGVQLKDLANPPEHLVTAARNAATATPDLRAAYLLEATGPGQPHPVLGLVGEPGVDWDRVAPEVGHRLAAALPAGEFVDLYPLEGPLLQHVEQRFEPIFSRS